jgi:YCII-like protein
VIFAHTESRGALQKVLEEDCYYPDFTQYEIREFAPKLIAAKIADLAESP